LYELPHITSHYCPNTTPRIPRDIRQFVHHLGLSPPSALPFLPPPCVHSLAPLSLSSGGSAGQSDWERGGRPYCTTCCLGHVPSVGVMPRWISAPASWGGAGRRQDSPSLRRPWWTATRAGSGHIPLNNPAGGGSGGYCGYTSWVYHR
jgi:hypothetical protein